MVVIWTRINTLLLLLVLLTLLAVVGLLANGARGGSLDPDAPPAATMKSLDDVPGSWNRVLQANDGAPGPNPPAGCDSSRFECLDDFFNAAVLDRETGLVWERAPGGATTWGNANSTCLGSSPGTTHGTRRGWRLPTFEELQSLVQSLVAPPLLPPGNPFIVATDNHYWTATSAGPDVAFVFDFDGAITVEDKINSTNYIWCVRGGQGFDGI